MYCSDMIFICLPPISVQYEPLNTEDETYPWELLPQIPGARCPSSNVDAVGYIPKQSSYLET